MNIVIRNSDHTPIYQQIYQQLKDQIIDGSLQPDAPLPSIRNLAKELRVSIITTKRAYEELERDGFLYTIVGKGCFVAAQNEQLLQELHLQELEQSLQQAVLLAKRCHLTCSDLMELVQALYEEEKE